MSLRVGLALSASVALLAFGAPASAAPCGRPDVDFTYPYDGAVEVPSNATLSAHYAAPAGYDGEDVKLSDASGASIAIDRPVFEEATALLRITSLTPPLAPGAYTLAWPALKGVNGGVGLGRTISFTARAAQDTAPPRFQGLTGIDWDLAREHDPCITGLEDRFAFALGVGSASDDSDPSLLALLLFQTVQSGVRLDSAIQVGMLPYPASGQVQLKRSADAAGTACFKARVVDLTGADSGGGEPEVCQKTQKPPFFEGCSLAPRALGRAPCGWFAGALALGFWLSRGTRAQARRRRR